MLFYFRFIQEKKISLVLMGTYQFQESFFVLNVLFPPSISVAASSHVSDVTKFRGVFCNLIGRRRSGCHHTQVWETIFHCDFI